jgi:hypothetical protein
MVAVDGGGGSSSGLLVLVLLMLMLFCAVCDQRILLGKDADNSGGDFVVDDRIPKDRRIWIVI